MRLSKIGLLGDVHGNMDWTVDAIATFAEAGIKKIIQVGDFGIGWPGIGGLMFQRAVERALEEHHMTMWIVPGNHENWDRIDDPEDPDGGTAKQILGFGRGWELAVLPRGYFWYEKYSVEDGELDRKFVVMGGAPSIDYEMRTEGQSWWPAERVRESDLKRLETWGIDADVFVTHDAPMTGNTPAVQKIIDTPAGQTMWSVNGLAYAREGQRITQRAIDIVNPKVHVHGHFHVPDMIVSDERTSISLGTDGIPGNFGVLDLGTLEFEFIG